jgi:CheY-like chemotaxis protein
VVINLLTNASDALEGRPGTISVRLRAEEVTGADDLAPGHYVVIEVEDDGAGMDEATRARVFEPFFTTKPAGKGTGLGLATVFGIVKQSKGFVWVYSEPGGGTTFKVYLPAVNEPVPEEPTVRSVASATGGGETILVAEDDPGLLEITREVLENNGYTVLPASGGDEALRIATQHTGPIALLLSDLVMGGLGGHALAKRLGQSRPQTRVLFMSGYTADSLHQQGAPEEAMPILEKPFHAEALLRRVREVLDAPDPETKAS